MARPRTTSDEAVLAATARAIGAHGLNGLTLAAVADEAGLAPATLVQRFESKRGLLLALAAQAADGSRRAFEDAQRAGGAPLDVLHDALARLVSEVRTAERMANNLSFLQLDLADAAFRKHAAAQVRVVEGEIAGLLDEARAVGDLVAGTDTQQLTSAVQAAYHGTLILWGLAGTGPLDRALRTGIDRVLAPYRA